MKFRTRSYWVGERGKYRGALFDARKFGGNSRQRRKTRRLLVIGDPTVCYTIEKMA